MKASERDCRTVAGVPRERMENQISCMSGFLHIFDRHQILAGKRIQPTKRLPPSTVAGASPETVSSGESREFSQSSSSDNSQSSPAEKVDCRPKPPVMIPTFEHTSVADGDENHQRSTSVIARLMGLEPLSSSDQKPAQTVAKPALRRSISEPRVSRDLVHSNYIDGNNFQVKQPNKSQKQRVERIVKVGKSTEYESVKLKSESSRTSPWRSRSFFDSTDFFPESNQKSVTINGDFEKKLKMRGIDEQPNDLSTLKQILEVLQLKGLLRSTSHSNRDSHRNFVYDRNSHSDENSIVLIKPSPSSTSKVDYQRYVDDSRRTRKYVGENSPAIVDRSGRSPVRARTSSPNRIESNLKNCNSISKRKPLSIESSSLKSSTESPKLTPRRTGSAHQFTINRSPRSQKSTSSSSNNSPKQKFVKNVVTEDESSSVSESIATTSSTTDSERCREGKSSLQRCEKLLYSVAETNSATESPASSATVLPSPVSVLDSGFDEDELSTRSHSIDLKVYEQSTQAIDFKNVNMSPKLSPMKSTVTKHEDFTSDDSDFIYISEIVRASKYHHQDTTLFFSIEKKLYNNTENTLNVSKSQRKLVFDVVHEMLNRNRQLPPWKALTGDFRALVKQIWFKFLKIREIQIGDGVLDVVSGVVEKDLVEINDWRDYTIETSEAILDIERMIFKDLVSEAIRDLAEFSGECMFLRTRRKMIF